MPRLFQRRPVEYVANDRGCHVCTSHGCDSDGYPCVKAAGKVRRLYKVVYEAVNGPVPAGKLLRHTCDEPRCINPGHVVVGTQADNVADRVARGRSARGESSGRAKLTEEQARAILVDPLNHTEAGRKYGVDRKTVRDIRSGRLWSHLPRPAAASGPL